MPKLSIRLLTLLAAGAIGAPSLASAAVLESAVTLPHSIYVHSDNPSCNDATGSVCRQACVTYPFTPNARFQTHITGIPGRGDGGWTAASASPAAANGVWEWARSVESEVRYNGATGTFCSTGKNWSHNTEREFRVRVIY